ncbi:DMT family transporter [Paracoccus laeviglucosivorans]|nr:DMT family transporter [Paracoccus laeviglucosivorans]
MMVIATACFTLNDTALKLAMAEIPPFQALFMRGIGVVVLGMVLLRPFGLRRAARMMLEPQVQARNFFELLAALGFVFGLAHAPIADLTALGQTSPLILLLGAVAFFDEKLRPAQMGLIVAAFMGALLVAQPGLSGFSPYSLLGLWAAVAVAARDLLGRRIRPEVPGLVIAVGAGAMEVMGAGIAGALTESWVVPSAGTLLLTLISSAFLMTAHWLIVRIYRVSHVTAVAPFLYAATVWALLSGWLVFGSVPNELALVGMLVIVTTGGALVAPEFWARRRSAPKGGLATRAIRLMSRGLRA